MHTQPMSEGDGVFQKPQTIVTYCSKCKKEQQIVFKVWDSNCGSYEDEKFTCSVCGYSWWVEGPDA